MRSARPSSASTVPACASRAEATTIATSSCGPAQRPAHVPGSSERGLQRPVAARRALEPRTRHPLRIRVPERVQMDRVDRLAPAEVHDFPQWRGAILGNSAGGFFAGARDGAGSGPPATPVLGATRGGASADSNARTTKFENVRPSASAAATNRASSSSGNLIDRWAIQPIVTQGRTKSPHEAHRVAVRRHRLPPQRRLRHILTRTPHAWAGSGSTGTCGSPSNRTIPSSIASDRAFHDRTAAIAASIFLSDRTESFDKVCISVPCRPSPSASACARAPHGRRTSRSRRGGRPRR
jgi:hypothetical protein